VRETLTSREPETFNEKALFEDEEKRKKNGRGDRGEVPTRPKLSTVEKETRRA